MNYFFVFQNKTFEAEYRGGYLWAPQRTESNRKVSHWEKMNKVKRGDIILHSYKQEIVALSVAKNDVYESNKPDELSEDWQQAGWRVDTNYFLFAKRIKTSVFREAFLKLQPEKDAPFNKLGKGNTGYLFDANRAMYEFVIEKTAQVQTNEQEKEWVSGLINWREQKDSIPSELELVMEIEDAEAKRLTPVELAEKIKKAKPIKSQKVEAIEHYRNGYIKQMVKDLAEGRCQLCGKTAPFSDKKKAPYLEEHHVKRLADGGSDTMDNVVALCPNCHRKMHVLNEKNDSIILIKKAEWNDERYQRLLKYKDVVTAKSEEEGRSNK